MARIRSIGLELAKAYAARGDTVIAAVRDVSKAPNLDQVIAVKIDSESLTDAKEVSDSSYRLCMLCYVCAYVFAS